MLLCRYFDTASLRTSDLPTIMMTMMMFWCAPEDPSGRKLSSRCVIRKGICELLFFLVALQTISAAAFSEWVHAYELHSVVPFVRLQSLYAEVSPMPFSSHEGSRELRVSVCLVLAGSRRRVPTPLRAIRGLRPPMRRRRAGRVRRHRP